MSEFIDLIKKEKQEALSNYDEKEFSLELKRKISGESDPSLSMVRWFHRPVIAVSTLLLILLLGWLSKEIFLTSNQESDDILLKNTFTKMFIQHGTILDQRQRLVEQGADKSADAEFEWMIKRVLYAIQREKAQGSDISESLSCVLQNSTVFIKAEKDING